MSDDSKFGSVRSFGFRAPRISANFSFSLEIPATGVHYDATCTDISEEGLSAELPESIPAKTQVTMTLLFPGAVQPVQIAGMVEYTQGLRCGVAFLYSSPDEQKQVKAFIQSAS